MICIVCNNILSWTACYIMIWLSPEWNVMGRQYFTLRQCESILVEGDTEGIMITSNSVRGLSLFRWGLRKASSWTGCKFTVLDSAVKHVSHTLLVCNVLSYVQNLPRFCLITCMIWYTLFLSSLGWDINMWSLYKTQNHSYKTYKHSQCCDKIATIVTFTLNTNAWQLIMEAQYIFN